MRVKPFILAMAMALNLLAPLRPDVARADERAIVSATATLTILAGAVRRVPAGEAKAQLAIDGESLVSGDRILTGVAERALVTFLDGTTVTVEPETDIVVQQADVGTASAGSTIQIRINIGTVWARVVRLADAGSNFSLVSSTATAVVHEGLPGAQQFADGRFKCWSFDGDMLVYAGQDQSPRLVQAHATTSVDQGGHQIQAPGPITLNSSTLRISASASVLPVLAMPDRTRVAGFVAPGIEVNQVFGSFTDATDDAYTVEVGGGEAGPFVLEIEGVRDDAFTVEVTGLVDGQPVYQRELAGNITAGERLVTEVTQQLQPGDSARDPHTGRILSGAVRPLVHTDAERLGRILLSPAELQAQGGE